LCGAVKPANKTDRTWSIWVRSVQSENER
jgi:hypothetical protein